nr:MAG TPA: hypothetical protein [Caudoviricetes sp.]
MILELTSSQVIIDIVNLLTSVVNILTDIVSNSALFTSLLITAAVIGSGILANKIIE